MQVGINPVKVWKKVIYFNSDVFAAVPVVAKSGQSKTQMADYCFHHANENVTTIVPLFSNPKNNNPQSSFYTAPR